MSCGIRLEPGYSDPGEGREPAHLLITLDRIPKDELQEFVDMDFGEGAEEDETMEQPVKRARAGPY